MGYKDNQVHRLTFNWPGDRSIPEVPIRIGKSIYRFGFDTGCGVGILLTDVLEDEIDYTLIGKSEALNRDGSHRGWNKTVLINEFEVFGETYKNVETIMADWSMFSSEEFYGTIGLAYFQAKVITLDYQGQRIAIRSNPINYDQLDPNKYIVLPLHRSTSRMQENLPFFEAEYKGSPVMVYMDTGKNYSYVLNPESGISIGERSTSFVDIPVRIGSLNLTLQDVLEVNSIAQAEGLPFPTAIEMNSDQIWKSNLLVTFDLIEQKVILRKL
ncbi:MAG: hypothetical protein GX971_05185 [Firmicutes bacterium]|nr:hypothetical protein [Bacillota bacterium]